MARGGFNSEDSSRPKTSSFTKVVLGTVLAASAAAGYLWWKQTASLVSREAVTTNFNSVSTSAAAFTPAQSAAPPTSRNDRQQPDANAQEPLHTSVRTNIGPSTQTEALKNLDIATLAEHVRGPDAELGAAAWNEIFRRQPNAAREALFGLFDDLSNPARAATFDMLIHDPHLDPEAMMMALRAALEDDDQSIVTTAAQVLAAREDPQALTALDEGLRSESSETRRAIVEQIGSSTAAEPLLKRAMKDSDDAVRNAAIRAALGRGLHISGSQIP
jgi:hypothetical protein